MKFTIKNLPKSEVEIIVSDIDEKLLEKYEEQSLKELSSKLNIKGFREGCIPEKVAREHIDPEKLKIQVVHNALPDIWVKAIEENKIYPIGEPQLEIEAFSPLSLKWKVPVRPELVIGEYKNITVDKKEVNITKKEADQVIEDILKRNRIGKEVDRAVQKGDKAEIDFEGKTPDGVPLDNTASKNHPIIIGEENMAPGFEDEIIGLKKGGEKEFEITFPKDYHNKNIAGKKIVFKVKVNRIEELQTPEIDGELTKKVFGKEMKKEEFEKEIESTLQKQGKENEKQRVENEFYSKLISLIKTELPEVLIKEEQEQMIKEIKQRIVYQGLSFEVYLQHLKKTEEEFKESLKPEAENRVKLQLGIYEISKLEKIEVTDEEADREIKKILERYDEKEQDNIRKKFEKGSQNYVSLKHQLKMQKTVHKILPQ